MIKIIKYLLIVISLFILTTLLSNYSFKPIDLSMETPISSTISSIETVEGNKKRIDYVNENGELIFVDDKYCATMIQTLDDKGNVIVEEYFDEHGNPSKKPGDYYALKKEYNDKNQNIITSYLDDTGNLTTYSQGYSIIKYTYDDYGHIEYESYYDKENHPVLNTGGYHGVYRIYDDNGRDYKLSYYGLDYEPVLITANISSRINTYTQTGFIEETMYYDTKGNPSLLNKTYYGKRNIYDEYNRIIEEISLDEKGNPYMNIKEYSIKKITYYSNNSIKSETYYDLDYNPVSLSKGQYGTYYTNDRKTIYLDKNHHQIFILSDFIQQNIILVPIVLLLLIFIMVVLPKNLRIVLVCLYIGFILYITLFIRESNHIKSNMELFWSYKQFFSNSELRKEILLNIVLFIPLGYMIPFIHKDKKWFVFPILLSLCIEIIQYVFGLGCFEFDDMISNGLGSIIGYFMGCIICNYTNQYIDK